MIKYDYVYKITFDGKEGDEMVNVIAENAEVAIAIFRDIEREWHSHEHRRRDIISVEREITVTTYTENQN